MRDNGFHRLHALRMENDAARYAQEEVRPRFDRLADRHENGAAPRAIAVPQLFQTPPAIADRLVSLLDLSPGAVVLEPSAGLGRLIDALQAIQPRQIMAVEINAQCAGELFKADRAGVVIKQRDFLTCSPAELGGSFAAVVMNPPFTMRSDIRHIQHALKFLAPGGQLAAICMNTEHRRKAFQSISSEWIELPADTFKETGTHVATVILKIIK